VIFVVLLINSYTLGFYIEYYSQEKCSKCIFLSLSRLKLSESESFVIGGVYGF
jgi:hypothetical protein